MRLLVSYYITKNYDLMRQHWKEDSHLASKGIKGTKTPIGKDVDLGGLLHLMDWDDKKVIVEKELSCPSGFDTDDRSNLYVASMRSNIVYVLDRSFEIAGQITHPFFNDLHSLNFARGKLIVASTGLDMVMQLSAQGDLLGQWRAIENGYCIDQMGNERCIDYSQDHRLMDYPTLTQTTHVNSALPSSQDDNILVSLFHQGKVIETSFTGALAKDLVSGMKNPHAINTLQRDEYMVSDTGNGQVLVFDGQGNIVSMIKGDFNWVQDASPLSNGNIILADSNNSRIVEVNKNGNIIDSYQYPKEWKIYQVKEVVQ